MKKLLVDYWFAVDLQVDRITQSDANHDCNSTKKVELFSVDLQAFSELNLTYSLVFNWGLDHVAWLHEHNEN